MKIETKKVKLSTLKPNPNNPRMISKKDMDRLVKSLTDFPEMLEIREIVCDETMTVLGGNMRLQALKKAGAKECLAKIVSGLTDDQKREFVIKDNGSWGEWSMDDLANAWGDLPLVDWGVKLPDDWLSSPTTEGTADAEPQIDRAEELNKIWQVKRGDLWQIGEHRLLCGDSTKKEDVVRVLNGQTINVAFTSPPYAEQREYDAASGFKPIPPDEYVVWFSPVARNVKDNISPDGSWFVNIKPCADGLDTNLYVFDLVTHHVRELGWHFATEFCWERVGVPKKVTRRFKNQFEPVYQFAVGEWKMRPDAVRHESNDVPIPGGPGVGSTTWSKTQGGNGQLFGAAKKRAGKRMGIVDSQGVQDAMAGKYIASGLAYPGNRLPTFSGSHDAVGHAAAFPVGLPQFFINAYSDPGDLIFDPFCGSGSTLVAAQRTDRIGAGIEISPLYCAVILQRMHDAFPNLEIRRIE